MKHVSLFEIITAYTNSTEVNYFFAFFQSSISTEIMNVGKVTIEQEAFSKLYSSSFKHVKKLQLFEKSFDFKHQNSVGRHGPVTVVNIYF